MDKSCDCFLFFKNSDRGKGLRNIELFDTFKKDILYLLSNPDEIGNYTFENDSELRHIFKNHQENMNNITEINKKNFLPICFFITVNKKNDLDIRNLIEHLHFFTKKNEKYIRRKFLKPTTFYPWQLRQKFYKVCCGYKVYDCNPIHIESFNKFKYVTFSNM
jgi:hypothetical protein